MPAERYYLNESLKEQAHVYLKDNEFHHLVRVMRARIGDSIELVNGKGILADAVIQEISKNQARLNIENVYQEAPRQLRVIVAQANPKPNRLDFILEKGTELGADEFWLFPSQLSIKKDFNDHQLERLTAITMAAMKQCGRLFLPKVVMKPSLDKWPHIEGTLFFGDTEKTAPPFLNKWKEIELASTLIFCIGPESGFTDKEIELLKKQGAHGVKLHENILRTDTASLVALSLIEALRIS